MARLDAEQFIERLSQAGASALAALYILSGDEPLLLTEAGDALRAAARRAGYTERSSLTLDARSDWSSLLAATQNVSLFGDRRLVDVALPGGKPGKTGADTLVRLSGMAKDGILADTLVVVALPRLDKTTRNTKWAGALADAGTWLDIDTIDRQNLPAWISRRLARQQQRLAPETLAWMADKVEGNLLAAHQEIQKLGLLHGEGEIPDDAVRLAVLNVARYDVFGLRDAMLAGDPERALRILAGLRAEGEALPLVLWAVGDDIRILARLSATRAAGGDLGAECRRQRVFGQRERILRQVLDRVPAQIWPAALQHAHDIDRLIKGLRLPDRLPDAWEELARLILRIALRRPPRR